MTSPAVADGDGLEQVNERQVLILTCAAHFLTHFSEILLPSLTMYLFQDLSRTSDISLTQVLQVGTMMYLLYGVLALPWGLAADRWGAKPTLAAGMLLAGAGYTCAGLAHGLVQLWLAFAVVGVGIAAYHPAGLALISKTIARRGRALGINGIWGSAGFVAAPLLGGVGSYLIGWRFTFIGAGLISLLVGATVLTLRGRESRHDERTRTAAIADGRAVRYFLIMCLAMMIGGIIYRANTLSLPLLLEENAGSLMAWLDAQHLELLSQTTDRSGSPRTLGAMILLTMIFALSMLGQRLGGVMADRHDLRWAYLTFHAIALPALLALGLLQGSPVIIAAAVFVVFSLGMQPIENSLIARLTPPRWRSTSYALKFIVTFGVGAAGVLLVSEVKAVAATAAVYLVLAGAEVLLLSTVAVLIFVSRGESMHQRQHA